MTCFDLQLILLNDKIELDVRQQAIPRLVYITNHKERAWWDRESFLTILKDWLSFNVFFSITTSNFNATGRKAITSVFHLCLPLHGIYALHFQSYRNDVEEISGNFKNLLRLKLAVFKKIVIFSKSKSSRINLFKVTS